MFFWIVPAPRSKSLRSCSELWTSTARPDSRSDLLSFVRPDASLANAQSALGGYCRCGLEGGVYWWSVLLPNLYVWIESTDGRSISRSKAQMPRLGAARVFSCRAHRFNWEQCDSETWLIVKCAAWRRVRAGSRRRSPARLVATACTINYVFGAYSGVHAGIRML